MQQHKEEEAFPSRERNLLLLLLAVARKNTSVTSSDRVGSKYLDFIFLFFVFDDGMNKATTKATSLHQQHQDLNFFLYLSEFSKEHLFVQTGSHSQGL